MALLLALGLLSVSWIAWKLLRHRLLPSPLNNIPGPASASFLGGVYSKLFNNDAWEFHKYLYQTCKPSELRISICE